MKIKIIAIAPHDGWTFIVEEKKIFLLRPPYVFSNRIEVSKKDVKKAIYLYGFEETNVILDNINEVVRFLKEEYIKSKENQGIDLPSSKQLRRLLKYATDDILLKYINRAKKELIPKGNFEAAEFIALELIKLEKVKNNPNLLDMTGKIIQKCSQERRRIKKLESEILKNRKETWKERFPNASKKYPDDSIIEYSELIKERGQFLPIGKRCV